LYHSPENALAKITTDKLAHNLLLCLTKFLTEISQIRGIIFFDFRDSIANKISKMFGQGDVSEMIEVTKECKKNNFPI